MQTREIKIHFKEFESAAELPAQDKQLIEAARLAALNAYAPY